MFGDPTENPMKWERKPLSESCQLLTGNTPSRKVPDYYGAYIEWIKSDNISPDSMFLSTSAERLSESGAAVGRIVGPGAILMTCIAGSLNTIGNAAIVDRQVAFNQQINALIPKEYEPLVLYYLLQLIRPRLHEATSSALKCILNKGTLGSIEAIVPEITIQKRFASVAEQSDKSKFPLYRGPKSQFIARFTPSDNSINITVENCCKAISGGGTPSMKRPDFYDGDVPFIKSGDVKGNHVSSGALWLTDKALANTTAKLVPAGSVIVVVRSAALRHAFHVAIADNPLVINQDLKAFHPRDDISPEFLLWAIQSRSDEILQSVQTMLTSHIETRVVSEIAVKKPSADEQYAWQLFVQQSDKSKHYSDCLKRVCALHIYQINLPKGRINRCLMKITLPSK